MQFRHHVPSKTSPFVRARPAARPPKKLFPAPLIWKQARAVDKPVVQCDSMPMGNSFTCHVNHPFFGFPIRVYPYARLGTAGDIGSHAAATNYNPAGASRANAEGEKRLAGLFYRRLGRRQRDREKPERFLSIGAIALRSVKKKNSVSNKGWRSEDEELGGTSAQI